MSYNNLKASPQREAFFLPFLCVFFLLLFPLKSDCSHHLTAAPMPQEPSCRSLIDQMLKAVDAVKGLKYDLNISERCEGKLRESHSSVKLQCSPRQLYLNIKGTEVLWLEGKNGGDALVNPDRFPYINLNLDPYGSLMMENQHHSIHEVGYDYFKDIISYAVTQLGDQFDAHFVYEGIKKADGRDAYKIVVLNNAFTYMPYKVKKDETLRTLAHRLRLSEYMIKEENRELKGNFSLKEGQDIRIPNGYAKMTVMLLDKSLLLPLSMSVYDDKGLFESYTYSNLRLNPDFAPDEFTKGFKDYHF